MQPRCWRGREGRGEQDELWRRQNEESITMDAAVKIHDRHELTARRIVNSFRPRLPMLSRRSSGGEHRDGRTNDRASGQKLESAMDVRRRHGERQAERGVIGGEAIRRRRMDSWEAQLT